MYDNKFRPWYSSCLDRCSKCYSYAVLKKIKYQDDTFSALFSFKCVKNCIECNNLEYVNNIGVAIADWNKLQRQLKKMSTSYK